MFTHAEISSAHQPTDPRSILIQRSSNDSSFSSSPTKMLALGIVIGILSTLSLLAIAVGIRRLLHSHTGRSAEDAPKHSLPYHFRHNNRSKSSRPPVVTPFNLPPKEPMRVAVRRQDGSWEIGADNGAPPDTHVPLSPMTSTSELSSLPPTASTMSFSPTFSSKPLSPSKSASSARSKASLATSKSSASASSFPRPVPPSSLYQGEAPTPAFYPPAPTASTAPDPAPRAPPTSFPKLDTVTEDKVLGVHGTASVRTAPPPYLDESGEVVERRYIPTAEEEMAFKRAHQTRR